MVLPAKSTMLYLSGASDSQKVEELCQSVFGNTAELLESELKRATVFQGSTTGVFACKLFHGEHSKVT